MSGASPPAISGWSGTANRGPLDEVVILGSSADALAVFGAPDPFPDDPAATAHLTLARTLEQLFAGGASTVYAVRVANLAADVEMRSMTWQVAAGAANLFTLTATSPGTWANGIQATLTRRRRWRTGPSRAAARPGARGVRGGDRGRACPRGERGKLAGARRCGGCRQRGRGADHASRRPPQTIAAVRTAPARWAR